MFIRTERLMLRPGWIEDAHALAQAIGEEAIVRNLARAPWPYAHGDAEAYLSRSRCGPEPDFLMFARTQGSPRLVGGIGLRRDADGAAELGYWVARRFWGLGFATEAGRAVVTMAHASLKLQRLVAGHFCDNPASGRVLRKLGFRATGEVLQRHSIARGGEVAFASFARDARDEVPAPMPEALAA